MYRTASNMKVTNSNLELVIVNMKAMKIWKGKRDKNLKKEELVFSEHVHRNVIHNVFKKDGSQLQC